MFEASASYDHGGNDQQASRPAKRFENYMIYRQGTPFLIVNAALVHVRNLVAKFAINEPEYAWTYQLHTA